MDENFRRELVNKYQWAGRIRFLTRELIYPRGEKFGMVLKGRIEFFCGEEKLILEEGDSVYCASTKKPKRMITIGEAEAKLFWIVFMLA